MKNRHSHIRRAPAQIPVDYIRATHLFRQVKGRSGGILALGEDKRYYLVKLSGNPSGPNSLANEELGARLAAMMDLTVPETRVIHITGALMRSAPVDWFSTFLNGRAPSGDLHLGSVIVGDPQGIYATDLIGYQQVTAISNRQEFLTMLLLDLLTNNQSARKAVFTREPGLMRLRATFLNHDSMFGGGECVFDDYKQGGLFFRHDAYKGLWSQEAIDLIETIISRNLSEVLEDFYREIPPEWYTAKHIKVGESVLGRLDKLPALVETLRGSLA